MVDKDKKRKNTTIARGSNVKITNTAFQGISFSLNLPGGYRDYWLAPGKSTVCSAASITESVKNLESRKMLAIRPA